MPAGVLAGGVDEELDGAGVDVADGVGERDGVRAEAVGSTRTLRDDEASEVAELVRAAERGFGRPVDVEFCFEAARLWLLQCRPVTAMGAA